MTLALVIGCLAVVALVLMVASAWCYNPDDDEPAPEPMVWTCGSEQPWMFVEHG
jgi:hypothetical protein